MVLDEHKSFPSARLSFAFALAATLLVSACSGGSGGSATPSSSEVSGGGGSGSASGRYQLVWDAVSDAAVAGYRLYYSTSPLSDGASAASVDVGNVTNYTFNPSAAGLAAGARVYFAVAALGNGIESPMSGAVSVVLQ